MLASFRALAFAAIMMTFLVILAGSIVRMTGSGMGCPDWPKCFGQYIPPTDASQLPANYKQIFMVRGKEIADFSAFKTWVEYVNRLLGALLGVVVVALCALSVVLFRKSDKPLLATCFALLVTVGFVGWLGSVVVANDLAPVKITLHMLTALAIVALSMMVYLRLQARHGSGTQTTNARVARAEPLSLPSLPRGLQTALLLAVGVTLVQVVLGTQVREEIDHISKSLSEASRDLWIRQLSGMFITHRTFSWVVVALNAWIVWSVFKSSTDEALRASAGFVAGLVGVEIALGVIMAYLAIPMFAQPAHLLAASLLFGVQWGLWLRSGQRL